jgi:hypothetical protein
MDPISELRAAGFNENEIADWSTKTRDELTNAGFKSNEIDAYFTGGVTAPDDIPPTVDERLAAGEAARKREGGLFQTIPQGVEMMSTPQGRQQLWEAVKQYPSEFVKGLFETAKIPGEVAAGKIDLSTDEGLDKAIGLGTLIGFGRLSKLPLTGKTSGFSMSMGAQVARIERGPTGEIYDLPIGGKPQSIDFVDAAKVVTGSDAPRTTQEKILQLYRERGLHPAEVAHDAQSDPVIRQELLSKDAGELPYGASPEPKPTRFMPVEGSPVPEGTKRSELIKTSIPWIDRLLDDPNLRRVIDEAVLDRRFDIPYGAGGSVPPENPVFFVDRDFPSRFTIGKVTFDPAEPFAIHENFEQYMMDILTKAQWDNPRAYKVSHHIAELVEGAWYRAHGIDQAKAEAAYAPYLKAIQRKHAAPGAKLNIPANLFKRPYPHDQPFAAAHEAFDEPAPTAAELAQAERIVMQAERPEAIPKPQEPPLAAGMTRMYHGGTNEERGLPLWFSSHRPYAEGYAGGRPRSLWYVDIPADHPSIAAEYPEQTIARGFHRQVELPSELADQRQLLDAAEPPKPPEPPPEAPPPTSYEEAQQKVLDRLSIGAREPRRPMTLDRLYTEAIDDLHPLKAVSEKAYQLARLLRGQFGKATYFLEHGTFKFNTYETVGRSLREILEPVRADLDGLRAYLVSKRALEIEASGRKSGVDLEAAQAVVDGGETYAKVAKELDAFQDSQLQYLRDSGVLSEDSYAAIKEANKNYVPFYRLIGGEPGGPRTAGRTLGPANPVKRLKGSEREIVDPLESIIKNTYAYISVAERNAVGIELIDALKREGFSVETKRAVAERELLDYLRENGITDPDKLADFIKSAVPEDGTELGAFRDGKRETVKIDDPELIAAFRGIDRQSAGMLTRIFAIPARTLRAGAVLTPDFMMRNLIRDFLTAFVNTSRGIFTPINTLKGLIGIVRKDADFQNWLKSGGANATMVAMDRRYLQESLSKLSGETGLMTRAWNMVKSPLSGLRMASELIENATRLGEFKKVLREQTSKEAMQAAAYSAREVTLDFARMGAKMRAYNMITAFANAQLQGVDRLVRAFKDRPVNTTLKIAGGITAPSVLLWFANHKDQRYQELPQWQKDLFWIILNDHWQPISAQEAAEKPNYLVRQRAGQWEFNNGSIWRVPKPFELGVIFGSGPERALEATVGKNPEAWSQFTKSVMQAITPNFIPTGAQPVFEQWANRSTFTDRTLIPGYLEKQLPEYQYTPYTTELSKKLGKIISSFPGMHEAATDPGAVVGPPARALSTPILIENYVRSWTGGLGMYAVQAADAALRKVGVLPDPIKPASTLADIPFIRAFAVRYPSATTQSIQDFYDEYERNDRFFKTWLSKANEGDAEAMDRIAKAGGPQMFSQMDAYRKTLTEHSKVIRDIYKNEEIPADEKRQIIDSLYYSMIEIARSGREIQREMRTPPQ